MIQSRVERGAARRHARHRMLAVIGVIVLLLVGAAGAFVYAKVTEQPERIVASVDEAILPYTEGSAAASSSSGAAASANATPLVEVPNVVGRLGGEAASLLAAAGLSLQTTIDAGARVADQVPEAGSVVASGTVVSLTLVAAQTGADGSTAKQKASSKAFVVCIDPGHQEHSDSKKEPVGPGASEMKARVSGGATGVTTGIPEYEIALQIAMNLKRRLESVGVKVVLTRTTNDVNLSNAERAQMANAAKANLFIRIHANGSADLKAAGVSTLYPGTSQWTSKIEGRSKEAAQTVQRAVLTATGAPNDGVRARTDLSGFNWATVPAILVECGYMSNPVEDKLLSSPQYQDKVAMGIATGVLRYLGL